tara:strand:- start:16556 stop:16759 length:204 start_codon:yes stop_codon:yes gene_type:complete
MLTKQKLCLKKYFRHKDVEIDMLEEQIKSLEASLKKIRDTAKVHNDVEESWYIEQLAEEALQKKEPQ